MSRAMLRSALALSVALVASLAWAQQDTVRVRGTIERVDGDTYFVKSRDGSELRIKLAPNASVVAIVQASLADVKEGSYVGVAAMPQADGSQKALEVHIFTDAMRGTGEGHRGWDLQAQSTMTNGTVAQTGASSEGQVLTLKYKDGEKKIVVPAGTPIVSYTPGEVNELKVGTKIFISAANKQPDGTLQAARVNAGRGVAPPM